ncbi:MAG: M24B family metallopeptidase, partial [Rickettsiales bacterium]|nr:M24B family metallopeptidase [Rickettsiales bacterium]
MNKLEKLREVLKKHRLDAYLVPMRDEFNSEYLPPEAERIKYLTNFTGSNGFVIITTKEAIFFTDGRYTLQAEKEIDKKIYKIFELAEKNEIDFLKENFKKKARIGFDAKIFAYEKIKKYQSELSKEIFEFIPLPNLIDEIWQEKPKYKSNKIFFLDKKFVGFEAKEKIKKICNEFDNDFLLLTSAESVCWLLNIRSFDLPNTQVLLSYALLNKNGKIILYCDNENLKKSLFKNIDIEIKKISEIENDIKKFSKKTFQLDFNSSSFYFYNLLKTHKVKFENKPDLCLTARAVKNNIEIKNIKNAHIKDGVALTKFFYWLENNLDKNLTEFSIGEKLKYFRLQNKNFISTSFDTIAGYAENGAIIHYRASEKNSKKLARKNILLLDSGGQYLEGTTDVTRTIALGDVTNEQKENFTLVLKGHINIASAIFPTGTNGSQIDVLARINLWRNFKDYKHGTGHGVGFCLNVHEGPHGIS